MATETRSKTNGAPVHGPLLTEEHLRPHHDHPLGSVVRQVLDALTCAPKDNRLEHATVVHLRDVRIGRIRVHRRSAHHTTSNQETRGAQPEMLALAQARSLEAGAEGEPESSYDFVDVEIGEVTYLQKPKEPEPATGPAGGRG